MIYVPDASRSVSVTQSLLTPEQRDKYMADIELDYARTANSTPTKRRCQYCLAEGARQQNQLTLTGVAPVKPKFIGRRVFKNIDLASLANYIDWGPFFQTWDLAGPYPAILTDEVVGEAATKVYAEGQAMLKKIIDGRWLTANGVIALLPANSVNDDDIEIYTDDTRNSWRSPITACASRA